MDNQVQNPLFHALDMVLAYLNRGNSLPEITFLSSAAEAWCHHHLLNLPPFHNTTNNNLDDVLQTHPYLFDLSIRSFARLYAFTNPHTSSPSLSHHTTTPHLPSSPPNNYPHTQTIIPPLLTAQHIFSAILDAYTLSIGSGKDRPFHDRIAAQDLRHSPIIHSLPDVVRGIAALDPRELLTTQFSTFSPKTSWGFSCYLAKGFDVVMMDAPPVVCPEGCVEFMDVDDAGSSFAAAGAANPDRQRSRRTPRPRNRYPDRNRVSKGSPERTPGLNGTKRSPSGHSRGKHSRGVRKKRRKKHE